MIGIVSYGAYIPKFRIKPQQIARAWGKVEDEVEKSLGVFEKTVASVDEDAVTLAIEAAFRALINGGIDPKTIGAITVGSESHPYAVKPSSTTVAEILGMGTDYLAADLEFACKAGTAGIQLLSGLISQNREAWSLKTKYVLAIGSDVAQSKPSDVLEYTASSAAAAFVLGKTNMIANILDFTSYSSDTPDFWRKDTEKFPSHAGRFTGAPAYFAHVIGASQNLLKKLGFTEKQIASGFVVPYIGNPYSASSMIGLAAVLDIARPKNLIFVCSYGSGAGSDAFVIETTSQISAYQRKIKNTVARQIKNKEYIDYSLIAKNILTKYRI